MAKRFTITDETVHHAFELLRESELPSAEARAMREKKEDERKAAKAAAFLASDGTVAERDAKSILHRSYKDASDIYYEAVKADEFYRNQRSNCMAIIEGWRTCQSNERAMARIG